ncbi:protein SON isoform X4 [Bufo gargarizans]|uniref:protein SON isoform X4 n=1 Tax=Bufo gargarizans TaxID=30331 RepID=UPI001CF25C31|nr:protein SON isoform X4 [Bufo gargarizans]
MATNIEQIFRSFVVNKFKEIQEENRNSENMDSSPNGELAAPGTEDASEVATQNEGSSQTVAAQNEGSSQTVAAQNEGSSQTVAAQNEGSSQTVAAQNEGSSQTVATQNEERRQTVTEDTESKLMEVEETENPEKESESKDLKTTDLSSDDDGKKDSSKKKSKKHKKHKSKKKKKKKKKEKNEKRSKSASSVEDQENVLSESKSAWKPVISSPSEQNTLNTSLSQMEENVDPLPSMSVQDHNVDSVKEHPARPQSDIDSGFFGPKCPNEMHFSNNLTICEVEMTELSKEPPVDCQQNIENLKCSEENNEKPHTNCETAEALQNEILLPQPVLTLSEEKTVELGSRLGSETNEDPLKQSDNISSIPLQPQSKSAGENLSKAREKSKSKSLAREKSRSKSLTKVPKKQANLKSRQRSRSSSIVRRRRSRSSSFGQRRRSKSKSPVRRRRSKSSTPARYSKSPIRSWWSKSIKIRQRSVSIERRRRSRSRSLAKKRRSRSRSSEKGHYSRTRSSAKRIWSRSRSANRRKSRSTSRKHRHRSRSASRRKSRSAVRTSPKSSSPSRKRKSKSASPRRRQKSKTSSPVRHRSRSRSAVQKYRSRSGAASRRHRSRTGSDSRRRKSRSGSALRRRRSRSPSVSRRQKSRSPSVSRRLRLRSPSVTRRRRSRSPSVTRRRRSRSPSVTRRRRSRSPSVTRRRRSRSPSVTRRRRSRSPSVTRRRRTRSPSVTRRRRTRSPSVTRRRRTRSPSVTRRRRTRSPSVTRRRRTRSPSVTRRRRTRSPSVTRRRRTRSPSVTRRRRTRSPSVTRRRRTRSPSVTRRRRTRSPSVSRRRRTRSPSVSRRRRSRSASKTRKSGTGSDTRRPSSGIQGQKSQSSATRKSRSTSVARGEQSTLLSSASKVQSRDDKMSSSSLERRSRSKGKNEKSRSRSRSIPLNSKSAESEPALQTKSVAEQRIPGTMSLDENQLSISTSIVESVGPNLSTVEKHVEMKLLDSSTSLTEPKNCASQSKTSSPMPCNDNGIEIESSESKAADNVHSSSTMSVEDDHMKFACFKSPTDQTNSTECDMDIEEISFTPIETDCMEQPVELLNVVKFPEEASEVENTKVADLILDEPEQKTLGNTAVDGTRSSSADFGQFHGLSQLASSCTMESTERIKSDVCDERSMVAPLEVQDLTNSSCLIKPNMEDKLEFAQKDSDSICKTYLNAIENSPAITKSPDLTLPITDPLSTCMKNAENQLESLQSSSTTDHTEGKAYVSPIISNNEILYNKQENIVINSLVSNESHKFSGHSSPSTMSPGWKHTEEEMSTNLLNDNFSHQRSTPNFKSPTINYDISNMSHESKEEILESSQSEAHLQRMELKIVQDTLSAEHSISSPAKQSSSHDIRIYSETEKSDPSFVAQSDLLDNSTYKELVSNDYNFKETGESEVSHPFESKTKEVKLMKENKQSLSSMHIHEDLTSTCQAVESNILPGSSPYMITPLTTSPSEVEKLNVLNKSEYSSMEEKPASESTPQNIPVPLHVDDTEYSRSKELTTSDGSNITNLTSQAHPSKLLCSSTKISEVSPEENTDCTSVISCNEKSLTDSAEDKMEIQRPGKVLSNTINAESYSDECKRVPKPSPFNNWNESCTKQDVDTFLHGDGARLESSSNSMPSSVPEDICHFEENTCATEQNSLTAPFSEKQCFSASQSSDGSLEKVDQKNQDFFLAQNIEHTVANTETDKKHCSANSIPQRDSVSKHNQSVSKDLAISDDCNSQGNRVKSCTPESGPSFRIQQKVISKIEERMNFEEEGSIKSLTKEPELQTPEQRANAEPTCGDLRPSMSTEDTKLSPKPLLHETGRLSVSSMPVQFKFSKTFKTLGVSQLCSTSEDSSDVESSKVNTSSSVMRNTTLSASDTSRSRMKTSELPTTPQTSDIGVEPSKSCASVTESSQSDNQSSQLSEKDGLQPESLQAADDSQTGSSAKHTFPHISNAASKLGVKQRQYRSRSVAQDSRTPSVDRGHGSRSRSGSQRRRSHSKSSSRKKRSQSTARKKSSHSKSDRKKRSRSRERKRRSQSKGKKKRSTSKLSGKRKHSRSKSSEKIGSSKSSGKQRKSRSTSKTRKKSKTPEKKERSRSKSQPRKNLHSKTSSSRKRSRSKSSNRRRKSRSKSLSSRSRSRSVSASWKRFSRSKPSLHRKLSHSSSRSISPLRRSRSINKRRSFSRSPAARSPSRSRSRWHRSRSRGRWRRSRSLSTSRRRSRSTSRPSLSTKKRKSLSPSRRRRSRSQNKQKDKSPLSKRKSASPQPLLLPPTQKKIAQSKPAGFKHSIGLKSLIQKQLSQAKSQGSAGKLSKEQVPLPTATNRSQFSIFSARTQASMSNMSTIGQIPVPNLADVPLPNMSAASQIPMPSVPPAEPLSMSSLAAETQLSVPDLTTANQWHVPDMSGAQWSVPDIAAGTQWSMTDLGTATQWPMSDLTAGSHWPMHDLTVGAQWSMPDLAAGTQWAVPDVATGAQWAVPDLAAGTQWAVPDLTAGSQWAMANMTAGAQWAVPDLAATAQWAVPDLTAGAHIQRADLAPEAQVPGSDLALEAQVPGSDLATEAQVPGSDLAAEAQVPGFDMVAEAQLPPEHDLTSEEHNMMPDVAAEALVPVASSTFVPDVAAGIPLPDVAAQLPVPDVAATIHMPDVATEAQNQMSDFVATQAYMSLAPKESVEDSHYGEPDVSSKHQEESDSCAFVQESSLEPNVNVLQNFKMEETLSSVQQLPVVCTENTLSTELSEKNISLDKGDLQIHQDAETHVLINPPQVESAMEPHLNSVTCRSSDASFASSESSDYSVPSESVESNHTQEELIDCHKNSDTSLQFEPHANSNFSVESQSSPIQTACVEPNEVRDQPLIAVTNSMTDDSLKAESYNSSDHMVIMEVCSKSVSTKWVSPYASHDDILQNETSVNSNTTQEIDTHSISDVCESETCTPDHSQQVVLNPSLGLPYQTERCVSPEKPRLVEPYTSPDHPQLVEPYTSPVHPQLVEPYPIPQHRPLVELYSSPEHPHLVEPYASPDLPQLVEPYASPDRQQLFEPETEQSQTSRPISPALVQNTCSLAEKPEEHSDSVHILTHAAVTCTQVNSDSPCSDSSDVKSDFSQVHEYSVTSDLAKKQDEIVDYSHFSEATSASVSVQEVPCPNLLKTSSESSFIPKELAAEECSWTEGQLVEMPSGSPLEPSSSPSQLCSPHPVHHDESCIITNNKPSDSCSSDEPKFNSSCVTTNHQLPGEQCLTDEHGQSKELYSVEEDSQPHKDFISSEQVQDKTYNIPVQPQENVLSPSVPHTNEQCLNATRVPFTEYEHPSADSISHPDKNLCVTVVSNTIINLQDEDPIMPLPDIPEQETIPQHSHSEESKAAFGCDLSDKLVTTQVDELLEKPHSSDPVVLHDSQDSGSASPSQQLSDCPNRFLPEHSTDADQSTQPEDFTKIKQRFDQTITTGDSNTDAFQSQEFDGSVEKPFSTENTSFPTDLPCLNQDELQCMTSNQTSDLSECMEHKPENSGECIKTDNHFTSTPPDLLPYDSDQPPDVCSEPSSEPVSFNSQPPPELLPYDSEQPANSFLSTSDYSTEQGSLDFHAPPELLPYDSDQPAVLQNQPTEPTGKELPEYESTVSHHETNKVLDLHSVDSGENCGNSESLNMHEIPQKCEPSNQTFNDELNFVKEVSSECSIKEVPSTEQEFISDTLQEPSVPSAVVDCTQEDHSSSQSSTDEHLHTAQPLAENEQPVLQPVLDSEIPADIVSRDENDTEQTSPLTNIPDTNAEQFSSSYELENTSESETLRVLPLMQDEVFLETTGKSSPLMSLTNAECQQPKSVCTKTDHISEVKSRPEHSRSRSIDRKQSTSKSASQNKRSRSKSVTQTEKSHSKSLARSRRTKSRSASTESNRQSPVVKRKKSASVVHKRSSRSASRGRRLRSRSSSLSPRKRSRSSSWRRLHSQSRQRHSRSPEVHKRSRSPSVTSKKRSHSLSRKRRSPSASATRKKSSPSPATRRRRTPSPPATRRRRSPSVTRRRRSRSPSVTRRRRSRSPSVTRRRRSRSPSASRRRRSPSPFAARRRRSPSPAASRRRRSPSPAASRRRRSPSPAASRRRRSPSPEFRRKKSPSLTRKRRSRSTSASRRRRSRSASQRKRSCSPAAARKRRSKSKSPSKSPTGKQLKSDRSRSPSQSEVSRKRKSRSSSRDKKTDEKRRKRSSSKDSSKDYYSIKQRRKSRTPPRRKKSRSPSRRGSVCKSPVRRRRSRSPVRRKSFSRSPIRRKRSRSRDKSLDSVRSPKRLTDLDKAQLLEIAKANAAAMCVKAGVPLPASLKPATPAAPMDDKNPHRTYGVTIQELTEKCKQIAQSKEDDVIVNKPHDSDDEEEDRPFYNHPFKVSEHKPISFSLLNPSLKPAPKTQVTLTKEFPVSSGSQHRKKESDKVYGEWVPVAKNTEESKDDVFTNTGPSQPVDITSAMNERAVAQTRLTGNPYDIEALYMLNRAQEQIDAWAQSTSIPGQFTGSTGAQVLSAEEISNSGPQAWLKKDQFLKAAPVTGGRGALLMRKMGWKEGEGLGRNNEGNVDPILLDFKTDRKGLVADGEKASNKLALPAMKDLSGKHPISALMELCNKKKWSPPEFELVDDTGPEHRKRFLFRVTVNGVLCQPSQPSLTKKLAKATAAATALQALGALPKESMTSTSNFCSASTSTL